MTAVVDPVDWILDIGCAVPDRVFLRTPAGLVLRYGELVPQTGRWAAALLSRGVVPGDRVVVQVDKSVEAVLLYLACLRLGAVFVPVNTANTTAEVEYFLNDSQPQVAVVRPADRPAREASARRAGIPHLETLGVSGDGSLPLLASRCAMVELPSRGGSQSPAAIVYTSGTTGRSKGAVLTLGNLASNGAALARAWAFTPADVLLHTLPLFHVHGLFAALNTVLASGACLVLAATFDAAAALAGLRQATVYMGVPTHYTRWLQEPGLNREATARIRLFVSGSAPLLASTHREFFERTGHAILERYGMTETLMITSNPYAGERIAGAVGTPLPGVEVRVAGTSGVSAVGEIQVRGPNVFLGYWRDDEKTRSEFTEDGWFKTGDLGRFDDAGYLSIVGRAKDVVISGGYNVYPKEVEAVLDALPGVRESAVFGLPHPDLGEGVTAAVVGEPDGVPTEGAIIAAVKTRLAGYKVPKRIVFVDELPRNAMGKVQKNALRTDHAALYQAEPKTTGTNSRTPPR